MIDNISSPVLIIGEAPAGLPGPALTGVCGARLAKLAGVEPEEYRRLFARVNVFESPRPEGSWDQEAARAVGLELVRSSRVDKRTRLLIGLGRRVEDALGLKKPSPWYCPRWLSDGPIVVAPHPSGRSRVWNDPEAHERAGVFWRRMAYVARTGDFSVVRKGDASMIEL